MRSPNIRGDTEMEISYNVEKPEIKNRGGWKGGRRPLCEEVQEIYKFLESDKENISFAYESVQKAKNKVSIISRTVTSREIPVTISRRANQIYIERK